jgi:hypothetical protein
LGHDDLLNLYENPRIRHLLSLSAKYGSSLARFHLDMIISSNLQGRTTLKESITEFHMNLKNSYARVANEKVDRTCPAYEYGSICLLKEEKTKANEFFCVTARVDPRCMVLKHYLAKDVKKLITYAPENPLAHLFLGNLQPTELKLKFYILAGQTGISAGWFQAGCILLDNSNEKGIEYLLNACEQGNRSAYNKLIPHFEKFDTVPSEEQRERWKQLKSREIFPEYESPKLSEASLTEYFEEIEQIVFSNHYPNLMRMFPNEFK